MKNLKTIKTYTAQNNAAIPVKAVNFMNFWQEKLDQIPEEFIDSARVKVTVGSYYGEPFLQVEVTYERPETTSEMLENEKLEAQEKEVSRNIKMQEYNRLKEELFGTTND